jgi:hypothetical protein
MKFIRDLIDTYDHVSYHCIVDNRKEVNLKTEAVGFIYSIQVNVQKSMFYCSYFIDVCSICGKD